MTLTSRRSRNELACPRSRISRLLTRAREVGIVQVTIVDEFQEEHGLSRELESMYGLKRVVVCPISESSPPSLLDGTSGRLLHVS